MKRLNLRWPVLALLLALPTAFLPFSATPAYAQATTGGTITGVVSDPSGAVVPGATVTITDIGTKAKRTTLSNKNGQYVLPAVPPGTYDITASKPGFSMDMIPALTIAVGTQTTANFKMAVGAENTTITVQASGADLQTMNASTAETVDPALVEALPAISRDASQFAAFQPGVTPGGNVAGTVQDQSVFQLDGGNASSDMDGSTLSYTGTFNNSTTGGFFGGSPGAVIPMPQDSVEEVHVATTGQTADFNNSSGMQVSVATKRGHDRWTGTVYEYYLDSNIGANSWQNNFPTGCYTVGGTPTAACANPLGASGGNATINNAGANAYTPKSSYHFNRFGAAAGGPIAPTFWGGKTYLFAMYEGFRYPAAATFERAVPSAAFLAGSLTNVSTGTTYSAAQLQAADPRHENGTATPGVNPTLLAFFQKYLPNPNTPTAYAGVFDSSCTLVSSSYCDSTNTIGFRANIAEAQSENIIVSRIDHDFGAKWHFNASFRYLKLTNQTGNQVDIGGQFPGDVLGAPKAIAPRPQQPIYLVAGVTTNISTSLTNDFHVSFLRNFWQWKDGGDAPQVSGWGGAIEPGGEGGSITGTLVPTNVNAQSTRTRIWDGKDTFFGDNVTKLKGDHIIQLGGQFQHNFDFHNRTDNGNSINYSTTYQIGDSSGAGLINFTGLSAGGTYNGVTQGPISTTNTVFSRILASYYGFVTDTQGANTYTNTNGTLSLNPPLTPIYAHTKVDYYNLYATDTWHLKPGLTLNYGLSYAIETPPYETNGNQVMFTDYYGNAIQVKKFLANRQAQAISGNVFQNIDLQTNSINPIVGTSLVRDVANGPSGGKYPYNPFFGALSPRISFAYSPKTKSPALAKVLGDNATVIRAGYGRIYGRINGVIQVLNPLLSPGLILATQCKYAQSTGQCLQTNFTDATAFRFGTDGTTAPFAAAPNSIISPSNPVYHPGIDGPGVAIGSPLDPTYKPNNVDTFNFSIQRQINRKMLVEVGYIGRLIHNELETLNPNQVPYQLTLGNQSFASAYAAIEGMFGCTTSAALCSVSATPSGSQITPQPFFEAALGGTTSAYCTGYSSCTAAVVTKQASNFRSQKIFTIWSTLDNDNNGTSASPGFVFHRTLMGTALTGTGNASTPGNAASYGSAGQFGTGLSIGTPTGYGNYNGAYVTFKASDFHGITLQENLTYSKALGLDDSAQSSSGLVANDSFDLRKSYGRQSYDQKIIFNTFLVYQSPYYKDQNGIIGRIAGGWTISPVLTAGTGTPLGCGTLDSSQAFGGADGNNFTDNEECVFTKPYTGGYHTHRGVMGSYDNNGVTPVKVGTVTHTGGPQAAVNMFTNPAAVYDTVRAPILGVDELDGGEGPISGLGYLNLDLSIKKKLVVYKKYSLELTAVSTNVMNHLDFSSPSLSIASPTAFGVTKTQGNSPRQIQMGVRAYF
jgi:hypothetical protein